MEFPKQDINKKNFEFAEDIAAFYNDRENIDEIIKLLRNHIYPTADGLLQLSIESVHMLIARKTWLLAQENKAIAIDLIKRPILQQLQIVQIERDLDPKIQLKVKKEITPWLTKFITEGCRFPPIFEDKYILSSNRPMNNVYNYNLLINKTKSLESLNDIDRGLLSLNYYLMLIEGPFKDFIYIIFAIILLIEGRISIPSKWDDETQFIIKKIEKIIDDNRFSLGWKKEGLVHYKMPYLSSCLDNQFRNEIAHLNYQINENGQIFREDGTELKIEDLFDKNAELLNVIDAWHEIFGEIRLKQIKQGIEEILQKITKLVKDGINPWHMEEKRKTA